MPLVSDVRPVIDRQNVSIVVVEEVVTGDARRQRSAAAAVVAHWESAPWPAGLVSQILFTSTDGDLLLTYAQWSSAEALDEAGSAPRPDWRALGVEPGAPTAYELYRVVRPTALPDPPPLPQCYPAAVFAMDSHDAARKWIDGLLDNEEQNEGQDRAYPGALAANFHIAADGTGIFLLSEWVSEAEAVAHIEEVIVPLLEYMGQGEAGAGARYSLHTSVHAS
ncbi:hypothetical protein [Streptomyces capitiformicae]|uniref:Antibiotic biosynthesis monooxygenase n=1 Tax=Streptomyces capitiformicae TaxID=2014920 RepID=A0A919GNY4_9ACTN|nr:hypothetical protein [Streptomyces capitiformicae]GHH88072.1 hypothetical protein GCM10017771_31890 [Streptomyces capitiformicae]